MIRIERTPPRLPSPKRALRSPLLRWRYRALPPSPPIAPSDQRANRPLVSRLPIPALPLRLSIPIALRDAHPLLTIHSHRTRGLP